MVTMVARATVQTGVIYVLISSVATILNSFASLLWHISIYDEYQIEITVVASHAKDTGNVASYSILGIY